MGQKTNGACSERRPNATTPLIKFFFLLLHLVLYRFVEFGREDGLAAGGRNGAIEGRVMGCEKGFELSREVGYYAGCAQLWKALAILDQDRITEK